MEYTQTQLIEAALEGNGAPMTLEQIISREIGEFRRSERRAQLLEAGNYYRNRSDVQNKTNEVPERSNAKIEHPIYRRLVDQKVRYLLSRPWTVSTGEDAYGKALGEIFDNGFRRKIRALGKQGVRDGIGWMQLYIDDEGGLACKRLPGHEVIPLWRDEEHQELDGFIRFYEQTAYLGQSRTVIGCAEYWYDQGVRRFRDDGNTGRYREVTTRPEPHFTLGNQPYNWENVPLVWLRYNDEELPLLRFVKELIDDYNWQTSVTADVLRDTAKFIFVLRNYAGEDLGQFVTQLRQAMAIQVEGDGGVDKLQADLNVDAVMTFLDKQRRDLYDFASAVDTKDPNLGSASGKAIGFRYMDLDADCADLGAELQTTFLRLKPFLDTWLQATGRGDFFESRFEIRFNTDMPVDETEIIGNINASASLLSRRTLLENHPWVKDVDKELEQAQREAKPTLPATQE